MISWIPWSIFRQNVLPIEFIVIIKFACFIGKSGRSIWNSVFHKAKFSFNVDFWFFVSSNVNIFDGVFRHEQSKSTLWVSSRMSFRRRQKSLWSIKISHLINNNENTYLLGAALLLYLAMAPLPTTVDIFFYFKKLKKLKEK